jgi:hypothetical protein
MAPKVYGNFGVMSNKNFPWQWGQPLTQDKTEIILKSYFIYALTENHICPKSRGWFSGTAGAIRASIAFTLSPYILPSIFLESFQLMRQPQFSIMS